MSNNEVVVAEDGTKTITKPFDVGRTKVNKVNTLQGLIILAVTAQSAADRQTGAVSDKLLTLARPMQDSKNIGVEYVEGVEFADKFISACTDAETYIKSKEAGKKQVEKLPRCWTQAKSNIKASINLGIDLTKYDTESALRSALNDQRKGNQTPVDSALKALKKELYAMPEDKALKVLANAMVDAKQALATLVPVTPIKADKQLDEAINK